MTSLISLTADPARTSLVIFALTYVVLGFGSLPPFRIDRTGATLIGATAMGPQLSGQNGRIVNTPVAPRPRSRNRRSGRMVLRWR